MWVCVGLLFVDDDCRNASDSTSLVGTSAKLNEETKRKGREKRKGKEKEEKNEMSGAMMKNACPLYRKSESIKLQVGT